MPLFSERNGYSAPIGLQYETISDDLRKDIYSTLYLTFQKYDPDTYQEDIYQYVWIRLWHNPIDEFPSRYYKFYPFLKKWINEYKWYEVYDLIEMIAKCFNENDETPLPFQVDYKIDYVSREEYQQNINNTLEYGQAGYRLIDKYIVPITNELEIAEIEDNLNLTDPFSGARLHISKALEQFSKRPEGDYLNTIKEAILAVEAAAKAILKTEKGTLSDALDELKKKYSLRPALIAGWHNLYGFTCDENGICHSSSTDEVAVDANLAKYMLIICSAFTNYLAALDSHSQADQLSEEEVD